MRGGSSWRWQLFWSAFVLLYAAYAVAFAFQLIRPVLPYLVVCAVLGGAGWLYWQWRRRWY